ncbi:T9SS type A sorting domain-containing protein [Eisenibacter elegans]|jgi:hypothetical protein|uniref:T9SS type A sorting domain-containing protein n=1 Tax=Eisenibacter elegans TaxID=997 RepID=UPI000688D242|nr:T9SS type A sorting domain-containing protein [Eisenibacter elegans]
MHKHYYFIISLLLVCLTARLSAEVLGSPAVVTLSEQISRLDEAPPTEIELHQTNTYRLQALAEVFFENEQLKVYTAYPNPASNLATIDYTMLQPIDAKVTVSNVLGSAIGEFELSLGSHAIRIPTNQYIAGVYFYTLSINGKIMVTKKLIVKH